MATALKVVVEPGRRLDKQRYTQLELEAMVGVSRPAGTGKKKIEGRTNQRGKEQKRGRRRRSGEMAKQKRVDRARAVGANCIYGEQPEQCANT